MTSLGAQSRRANSAQSAAPAARATPNARPLPVARAPESHLETAPQPAETVADQAIDSSLPVNSFEPAVLRLSESRQPTPLFVITHGAGGTADWHCHHYATLLGPNCTLLCPRGKRMFASDPSRGYYYPNHLALGQEVTRARESILARYADRVDLGSTVYVGYSQGASMGVLAIAEHGDWFPRMLLVEGGYESWSGALAKKYADTGGRRVLFVCGTERCRRMAALSVTLLRQRHVRAEARYAPGAGHRPDGPVAEQVREGLSWLIADDTE